MDIPFGDELLGNIPTLDIKTLPDVIEIVNPTPFDGTINPSTPVGIETPLISISENGTVTIDWNTLFDGLVDVTNVTSVIDIDLPNKLNLRPNLNVDSIDFSDANPETLDEVNISVSISNTGLNPAFGVEVDIFNRDPATCKDNCYLGTVIIPSINPAATVQANLSWIAFPGQYNINVRTDSLTPENNYRNNLFATAINVDPIITVVNNTVAPGDDYSISYNINLNNEQFLVGMYDLPAEFEINATSVSQSSDLGTWQTAHGESGYFQGLNANETGDLTVTFNLSIPERTPPGSYEIVLVDKIPNVHYDFNFFTIDVVQAGSTAPPNASIDSVTPALPFAGETVTLSGSGVDPDAGSITDYYWWSSKDGELGTSSNVQTTLTTGLHTIYLKVEDSSGTWGEADSIDIIVNEKPTVASMSITPTDFDLDVKVLFNGTGSDDGKVVKYEWSSQRDGLLSDRRKFSMDSLSQGTHLISFRVQDDAGHWSDASTMLIESGPPICVGDLDGDNVVGITDLFELFGNWGECPGCSQDLDFDGFIGITDLFIMFGNWGDCPTLGSASGFSIGVEQDTQMSSQEKEDLQRFMKDFLGDEKYAKALIEYEDEFRKLGFDIEEKEFEIDPKENIERDISFEPPTKKLGPQASLLICALV